MILTLKLKAAAVVATLAIPAVFGATEGAAVTDDDFVSLPAGTISYRLPGEFTRGGRPADAPVETFKTAGLAIMKRQVTTAEYQACVAAGACPALTPATQTAPDRPVVQVSWRDARAYAAWLSQTTGVFYRLPTDAEWAYAAGDRFRDDALPETEDPDPAKRWIARYEQEAARERDADRKAQPIGHFGANDRGLLDVAGNIWEWTDTCYRRVALDADGRPGSEETVNCGIRVVEGRHRSYMTDFIRDARSGGCAVGTPPANLGFRLVRDDGFWRGLRDRLRRLPWIGA